MENKQKPKEILNNIYKFFCIACHKGGFNPKEICHYEGLFNDLMQYINIKENTDKYINGVDGYDVKK